MRFKKLGQQILHTRTHTVRASACATQMMLRMLMMKKKTMMMVVMMSVTRIMMDMRTDTNMHARTHITPTNPNAHLTDPTDRRKILKDNGLMPVGRGHRIT